MLFFPIVSLVVCFVTLLHELYFVFRFFQALDLISDLWRPSTLRGPTIQAGDVSQRRVALSLSLHKFRELKPILSCDPFTCKQLVLLKKAVFWDVAPCESCKNRRFGGTCRLHLQGRKIPLAKKCVGSSCL
jgi:hypothetical protein